MSRSSLASPGYAHERTGACLRAHSGKRTGRTMQVDKRAACCSRAHTARGQVMLHLCTSSHQIWCVYTPFSPEKDPRQLQVLSFVRRIYEHNPVRPSTLDMSCSACPRGEHECDVTRLRAYLQLPIIVAVQPMPAHLIAPNSIDQRVLTRTTKQNETASRYERFHCRSARS